MTSYEERLMKLAMDITSDPRLYDQRDWTDDEDRKKACKIISGHISKHLILLVDAIHYD